MSHTHKILFITLSNIGDCILTLPVLDYLEAVFPGSKVTVMVGPRPKEIFENNPIIEKLIVYDKHAALREKIKLFNALKKEKFDIVVDLKNTLFGRFLPAKYKGHQFLFTSPKAKHMRDAHLLKILYPGLSLPRELLNLKNKSLYIKEEDRRYIVNLLKVNHIAEGEKIIAISAGARSEIKRWPKEKFVDLISIIADEFKAKIILLGDRDDIAINRYIVEHSKYPLIDLSGKTTLIQLACLLEKSSLLITNDSANLHLASYLDVPILAIFGPTDDAKYGPWSENWRVVKKNIFCRPCQKAQCRFGTLSCMQLISAEDLLRQVRSILVTKLEKKQVTTNKNDYKRILIVRTDRIGDMILSTPVIKALRDANPFSYIAMMVTPYTKIIVEGNPYLDEIIIYDKQGKEKSWFASFKFAFELKKKRFNLAVVLNPSNRSNLIPFLAGIPRRVGYNRKLGFLLTDRIKDIKYEGKKHEIEYNLDLVRHIGVEPQDKNTFMPVSPESEKWVENIFKEKNIAPVDKLIVLNPGSSDNSQIWPAERYAAVGEKLAQKGYKIVILGGPADREIAQQVMSQMQSPFINMVGNNNISQAASFLKKCSLFISRDTGLMHIASSIGVPIIAIFGRNQAGLSPVRWGPHNKKSLVLHKDLGCDECLAHRCKKGFLCLKAITVEDVLAAAEQLLKKLDSQEIILL
jgi:heptosyltransferase-2